MRLTNAMRESVAKKVAEELVKKDLIKLEKKMVTACDRAIKKLINKDYWALWESMSEDDRRLYFNSSRRISVYKGRDYAYCKSFGSLGDGYVAVSEYPNPYDWYSLKRNLDTSKINPLVSEWKSLSARYEKAYEKVRSFLFQFNTYKQVEEQWPDISRYLTMETKAKVASHSKALVCTGSDLNAFLKEQKSK